MEKWEKWKKENERMEAMKKVRTKNENKWNGRMKIVKKEVMKE